LEPVLDLIIIDKTAEEYVEWITRARKKVWNSVLNLFYAVKGLECLIIKMWAMINAFGIRLQGTGKFNGGCSRVQRRNVHDRFKSFSIVSRWVLYIKYNESKGQFAQRRLA